VHHLPRVFFPDGNKIIASSTAPLFACYEPPNFWRKLRLWSPSLACRLTLQDGTLLYPAHGSCVLPFPSIFRAHPNHSSSAIFNFRAQLSLCHPPHFLDQLRCTSSLSFLSVSRELEVSVIISCPFWAKWENTFFFLAHAFLNLDTKQDSMSSSLHFGLHFWKFFMATQQPTLALSA